MDRLVKSGFAVAALVLVVAVALLPGRRIAAQSARQSFDVLTGPASGSHFPVGEVIARAISHPPGLARCEKRDVCAPAGIIVSARTSDGPVANLVGVNDGLAASGLAQAPVVADAIAGRGPFRKYGRLTHIRSMADLFSETVQLVARGPVTGVAQLRGKRICIEAGDAIAASVLSGVRPAQLDPDTPEACMRKLMLGQADAVLLLDAVPSGPVAFALSHGARLVPIDGKRLARLTGRLPGVSAKAVAYRGTKPVQSISVRTLWVVNDSAPPQMVYGIVRALYNPANRDLFAQAPRPADEISLGENVAITLIPLHPGAVRFYREVGQLPAPRR